MTKSFLHEDNHNLQPGPGVGHDQGGTENFRRGEHGGLAGGVDGHEQGDPFGRCADGPLLLGGIREGPQAAASGAAQRTGAEAVADARSAARAVPHDRLPVQALQHRTAERECGLHDGFRDGRLLREVDGVHENHPDVPEVRSFEI